MSQSIFFSVKLLRAWRNTVACIFLLFMIACGPPPRDHRGPVGTVHRPNILLIVVDTLRADHLGCYGEKRPTSPFVDQLAKKGTLFRQAVTVMPATLPSFCSMLTSQIPRSHKVMKNGDVLSIEQVTLAEILQIRGYHTAAFISSFVLESRFGLNQGFEHYNQEFKDREADERYISRRGRGTVDAVFAWADGYQDKAPFFMMVHFWDPHKPYMPPKGYLNMVDRNYTDAITGTLKNIKLVCKQLTETGGTLSLEAQQLDALYSAEIRYTDDCIKNLIEGMEARGLLENTIVVLTADHGENMWEHAPDYFAHGRNIYHTSIHVPLIIITQGNTAVPKTIDRMVRSIDLAPTVLELSGIVPPPEFQGQSYAHLLKGEKEPEQKEQPVCFMEAAAEWGKQPRGVFDGSMKLIQFPNENYRNELYDIRHDPGEQINLAGTTDKALQAQQTSLLTALDKWQTRYPEKRSDEKKTLSDETKNKLKALGYVQ